MQDCFACHSLSVAYAATLYGYGSSGGMPLYDTLDLAYACVETGDRRNQQRQCHYPYLACKNVLICIVKAVEHRRLE
jgi:hypothetical protein